MGDEWENEVLCTAFSVVSLFLSCKLKVCNFSFFFCSLEVLGCDEN